MSRFKDLEDFFERRLLAAITKDLDAQRAGEYEEELERQRKLLDVILIPEIKLHRTDVQLLMMKKEEQERSPYPDQEENESPLIKEEEKEVWMGQGREQHQGLEEADTKFQITLVDVKSEDDEEEKPESSLLHQRLTEHMETAAGGEDCGRAEPARSSDPEKHSPPEIEVKIEASSDTGSETEVGGDDVKETRDCPRRLKSVTNKKAKTVKSQNLSDSDETETRPFNCPECRKGFNHRVDLGRHMLVHTKVKPHSCPDCGKGFNQKGNLTVHMFVHTKQRPFSCSECGKSFNTKGNLTRHVFLHSKEKPYSCSECGKKFSSKGNLTKHMFIHSNERPYSCFICEKGFNCKGNLTKHMYVHFKGEPRRCYDCRNDLTAKSDNCGGT